MVNKDETQNKKKQIQTHAKQINRNIFQRKNRIRLRPCGNVRVSQDYKQKTLEEQTNCFEQLDFRTECKTGRETSETASNKRFENRTQKARKLVWKNSDFQNKGTPKKKMKTNLQWFKKNTICSPVRRDLALEASLKKCSKSMV